MKPASNFHEQLNREAKAQRLVRRIWAQLPPELRRHPRLAASYAKSTEAQRCGWAEIAGENPPSEQTWARVVELLEERSRDERRYHGLEDARVGA